jgi:hypothetical protein
MGGRLEKFTKIVNSGTTGGSGSMAVVPIERGDQCGSNGIG